MNKQQSNTRLSYLTVLNIISCLSVVALHTNGVFWSFPSGRTWITANFIECICYFAVPVFFMCSGITLIDYSNKYSTKIFFQKRLHKTFIPFIIWSIIAFIYFIIMQHSYGNQVDLNPIHVLSNIFSTKYISIYWFFPPLFAFYLTVPVLTNIKDKLTTFKYMIVLGLVFISILPLLCQLLGVEYNTSIKPSIIDGIMILPVIGYYLANKELSKNQIYLIYILGIIGFILHFGGTILLSKDSINSVFKGYTNIPSILYSSAVFLFIKNNKSVNNLAHHFSKAFEAISKLTFGVYLIHYYVIEILVRLFNINTASITWRTIGTISVFIISSFLIFLLQKIPIIKKIVP